jgi:hypothetical protein
MMRRKVLKEIMISPKGKEDSHGARSQSNFTTQLQKKDLRASSKTNKTRHLKLVESKGRGMVIYVSLLKRKSLGVISKNSRERTSKKSLLPQSIKSGAKSSESTLSESWKLTKGLQSSGEHLFKKETIESL